ncbi:sulfotransferase family protein [Salinibacter sp.]|uniref:sulfotransferase family protein n=1 Tax=Salinibacter sp. TaxID=2065818 RepID=UPI0021E8CEF1|nr:sulfotransferase [Salinibacter sp.]
MENIYFRIRKNINACFLYDSLRDAVSYFVGRRPLRKSATEISPPPFFIVGSGRSGNTLLRAILTGHPNVSIPPESYVLGRVIRQFGSYSFLDWKVLLRLVLSEFEYHHQFETWDISLRSVYNKIRRLPEEERDLAHILDGVYRKYIDRHMSSATRWGDKTPVNTFHLDWIDRVFPEARYVHMVRDGRDVVGSYLKSEIYTSVEKALYRWKRSIKIAKEFRGKNEGKVIEIKYEDLVQYPENEIPIVCEFLNIDFSEDMLEFQSDVEELGDTHLSHHRGLKRPINTSSIGSWKNRLTESQKRKVMTEASGMLNNLGYVK